jgi:hypothetical protein
MPVVSAQAPAPMNTGKQSDKQSTTYYPSYDTEHRASSLVAWQSPAVPARFACHWPLRFRSPSSAWLPPSSSDASFSALDHPWPRRSQPATRHRPPRLHLSRQRNTIRTAHRVRARNPKAGPLRCRRHSRKPGERDSAMPKFDARSLRHQLWELVRLKRRHRVANCIARRAQSVTRKGMRRLWAWVLTNIGGSGALTSSPRCSSCSGLSSGGSTRPLPHRTFRLGAAFWRWSRRSWWEAFDFGRPGIPRCPFCRCFSSRFHPSFGSRALSFLESFIC